MVTYRKCKHFNSRGFLRDISMQDWGNIDKFQNPKDVWAEWILDISSFVVGSNKSLASQSRF